GAAAAALPPNLTPFPSPNLSLPRATFPSPNLSCPRLHLHVSALKISPSHLLRPSCLALPLTRRLPPNPIHLAGDAAGRLESTLPSRPDLVPIPSPIDLAVAAPHRQVSHHRVALPLLSANDVPSKEKGRVGRCSAQAFRAAARTRPSSPADPRFQLQDVRAGDQRPSLQRIRHDLHQFWSWQRWRLQRQAILKSICT
ncbi:unnamed protein product, partial [Urochloa humidicola]